MSVSTNIILDTGAVAGALVAICILGWKYIWPMIMTIHRAWMNRPIYRQLDEIQAELNTNGGSSLRDSVNRIERKVEELGDSHGVLYAGVDTLWELSPIGMWRINPMGEMESYNKAYTEAWGFKHKDDGYSDLWLNLLTDESRERAISRVENVLSHPMEFEYDMQLLDGRFLRISGTPVVVDGDLLGFAGTLIEVPESPEWP